MSVFDEDVLTQTTLFTEKDRTLNPGLFGRGKAADVAAADFLKVSGLHPGTEQLLTSGDDSIFLAGKLTASLNADYYDYIYGSEYSVTMGKMLTTVIGKQRGWYRGLPDQNTTAASYYNDIDVVDPATHPGYDPGESVIEVRAVFNDRLAEYQWQGLTEVRLVNDVIKYGSEQLPISVQNFQYGNMTTKVHGNDNSTVHGDTYATFQGDRTRVFNTGAHTVVVLGAEFTTIVGHEFNTNDRLKKANDAYTADLKAVTAGVGSNQPANAASQQWSDFAPSDTVLRAPMTIDMTQGVNLTFNMNAEFTAAVMRNALSVIGITGRFVKLRHTQGEALLTAVKTRYAALTAALTLVSSRVAGLVIGVPRVVPAPPEQAIELPQIPPIAVATPGAFTTGVMDAMTFLSEAGIAGRAAADAEAEMAAEFFAAIEEEAAAVQAAAEAAAAARAAAIAAEVAGPVWATTWASISFASVAGIRGAILAGTGSTGHLGNHLPDASLGEGIINDEPDNSQPNGFEIAST